MLLTILITTFGARYYWDQGRFSNHDMMARVALHVFVWMLLAHAVVILGVFAARAATSIARENERRTLDFLLTTRLSSAEIVLGKLATCMTYLVAGLAEGLPVMLLLHPLGAIDIRLILLAYAGLMTSGFFMISLAIWVSTAATDARTAGSVSVLWVVTWLIVPFLVSMVFTRAGVRLPSLLLSANAWVLLSSPISVLFKIVGGATPSSGLVDAVAWMGGLQVAGAVVLLIWAILRLRSAYRFMVSGEASTLGVRRTRSSWRWRPRPPVGDDPILWREMYTTRVGLIDKAIGLVLWLGMYGALGYVTYFFARPAAIELWRHGYGSGITSDVRPEWNLFVRFFMSGPEVKPPVDFARTDFNLYLRYVTTPLVFFITLAAAGTAAEGFVRERTRETWDSLIATPLVAQDFLRSEMLVALWRLRGPMATLLSLWTIGLVMGAIHPIGYLVSLMVVAAWMWLMLVFGLSVSIAANDLAATTSRTLGLVFLSTGTIALPFLLPRGVNSIVLGAGSPLLVTWLSLVSYRDIRNAYEYALYPALNWMRIDTGEGPLAVVATCLISIVIPTLCGLYLWRDALANFDRLIGRPERRTSRRLMLEARPSVTADRLHPVAPP